MKKKISLLIITSCLFSVSQVYGEPDNKKQAVNLKTVTVNNETAYIPSQCYTKTQDKVVAGRVFNPCYVCHTRSVEPNHVNDHDLQLNYSFPEPALENPWKNLFEDRSERIRDIADLEMDHYIKSSNYIDERGEIILRKKLATIPNEWDYNDNGSWDGYLPDCYFNFDDMGFDRDPDGIYSGWRAFAYYNFPGTFWPTNGSTNDVLIRLPKVFQTTAEGIFDLNIYQINLAIVEALIKRQNIAIDPVNEKEFGVDLNRNGELDMAGQVAFSWDPVKGKNMAYVGQAGKALENGKIHLAAGLFPEGTEFLHSVRYVDFNENNETVLSSRMKELRYMKKRNWKDYGFLEAAGVNEIKERNDFPDRTRQLIGNPEQGVNNDRGWILQGFIEDREGELRPQSFEETAFCIGCHGGTGVTTDTVYAFPRKLDSTEYRNGWFHWSQKGISGLNEPKVKVRNAGVYYEYTYYLMYNNSGNEFRNNKEVIERFFNSDGSIRYAMLDALHDDISVLLSPSRKRAMTLNKAYRTIVEDQDFVEGRDANVTPVATVYKEVEQDLSTGVKKSTSLDGFAARFGILDGDSEPIRTVPVVESQGSVLENNSEKLHTLFGRGMGGPDGKKYEVDWQGIIHKSRYGLDIPGLHFTFPKRLTLPTRFLVPLGKNKTCYRCHRVEYPSIPGVKSLSEIIVPRDIERELPDFIQPLTHSPSRDLDARWSPDNQRIVFVSNRTGTDQIWLMNSDGSNKEQLSTGDATAAWPQWSPDGQHIVFWSFSPVEHRYKIEILGLKDKSRKILVSSNRPLDRPSFHPDGNSIAYASEEAGNWDVWLVKADSGKKIQLTRDKRMETNPLWSPDGRVLAFKVAAGGEYGLTTEDFMTFENGYEKPTIHIWDGPESVQMNGWSPDGKKITYTAEIISDSSGQDRVTYAALVSDLTLKDGRAVAENSRVLSRNQTLGDRGPLFSADGKKIVFWAWDKKGDATIWLYDVGSDSVEQTTTRGAETYPRWSRDGKSLLCASIRKGNSEIVRISLRR